MMNGDGYLLTCVNLFGTGINEFDQTNKKGEEGGRRIEKDVGEEGKRRFADLTNLRFSADRKKRGITI